MSRDVVALLGREPRGDEVAAAVGVAGLEGVESHGGGLLQLIEAEGGRVVVLVGAPILVRTAGEVGRVLGEVVADVEPPVWWVECNAAEDVDGSEVPAMRFAGALVRQVGGVLWADDPAYVQQSGVGTV